MRVFSSSVIIRVVHVAQPYGLTMLRAFEDLGFHTGAPDKAAMNRLSEVCKKMRPLYPQVRTSVRERMCGISLLLSHESS